MLIQGDCLLKLKELHSDSVDSVITDPPAGISFMGKAWDDDKGGRKQWIAWMESVMRECLRVLKPGGHALVWAIPRTSHWTATAVEDAGFEIRDVVTHLFGSGFPKSLDISKAIDKEAGAKREILSKSPNWRPAKTKGGAGFDKDVGEGSVEINITAPATDEAIKWQGYGTALKPAAEFWILARKPLSEKTVAKNVLKHGTGGLNIDASRVGYQDAADFEKAKGGDVGSSNRSMDGWGLKTAMKQSDKIKAQGRFPANLVLSGDAPEMLDEQSGILKQGGFQKGSVKYSNPDKVSTNSHMATILKKEGVVPHRIETDTYGASRFFYCAKVSPSERNAGLEGMPDQKMDVGNLGINKPEGREARGRTAEDTFVKNNHPTVKPQKLMQYLIKLITPEGGTVLDPFMGSGSTGLAAKNAGFKFIGIEQEQEYFEIATKRMGATNDTENTNQKPTRSYRLL